MERCCANPDCSRLITRCFGFVIAGDLVQAMTDSDNGLEMKFPREICGICVFIFEDNPEGLKKILEAPS
jgi:hypothetical protein